MNGPSPLSDLLDVDDPAWPHIAGLVGAAAVSVEVLPVERSRAETVLHRLQVSAASTLGGLALGCGGLAVDHGWLRLLGGGGAGLPDLADANQVGGPTPTVAAPPALTVALDVLGGRFAINGGGLPGDNGEVCYWGADTLEWEPLGAGHSAFVAWALGGGTREFYESLRWPGWQEEVAAVPLDHGIAVYPPLCTAEGRDIAGADRRPVPFTELLALLDDLAAQVAALPPGARIRVEPTDET